MAVGGPGRQGLGHSASWQESSDSLASVHGACSYPAATPQLPRSFKCEEGASADAAAFKLTRHLRKKLQQIDALQVYPRHRTYDLSQSTKETYLRRLKYVAYTPFHPTPLLKLPD